MKNVLLVCISLLLLLFSVGFLSCSEDCSDTALCVDDETLPPERIGISSYLKGLLQRFVLLLAFMSCTLLGYSQEIVTVKQALGFIKTSTPPYRNAKRTLFPALEAFPFVVDGISDRLYIDMQCTKYWTVSANVDDLAPSLYLKIQLPSGLFLGALTYGGATDMEDDR